jgi:hypothetical protein
MKRFTSAWRAHAEGGVPGLHAWHTFAEDGVSGPRAWHAHAEDGVPGLRSANSYSLRPGTPPSAETVAFAAQRVRGECGATSATASAAGIGAAHAVSKNWLNGVGGRNLGCVRAVNSPMSATSRDATARPHQGFMRRESRAALEHLR